MGNTEYVHGTDSVGFALSEWPTLVTGISGSQLWKEANTLADRHQPARFVGHSFGASVALDLAKRRNASYTGYGRPGLIAQSGDVVNVADPVALFLPATKYGMGHSLASYATP